MYVIILIKNKILSLQPISVPESLLLGLLFTLVGWIILYAEIVCQLPTVMVPVTMGFLCCCCCSCTNGKIASSCQLCDGYCYNGGTCQLDPETNVPVCLWVFHNIVGILWQDFVCGFPVPLLSRAGRHFRWMFHIHLLSSIVPHWLMSYRISYFINLLLMIS